MTIRIKKSNLRYSFIFILLISFILIFALLLTQNKSVLTNLPNQIDNSQHTLMDHPQVTNDKDFLYEMIPHHEEAVETSYYVLQKTRNNKLREFTNSVVNVQSAEIKQMKQWYKEWFGEEYVTNTSYKPMMRDLTGLINNVLDRAYVDDMIVHHEGAILMAEQILEYTDREEIKTLAQSIIDSQQKEIAFLRSF